MTIALDTTALLARYLEGPFHEVITAAMAADPHWCASALALTEADMVLGRVGDDPERTAAVRASLRHDWQCFAVVPLDRRCLDRAAELGLNQPLRTSDALHLAAADRLPRPLSFATFDAAQIPVALSLGMSVVTLTER